MEIQIRFDRDSFVILENRSGTVFSADTEGRMISIWSPQLSLRRSRLNRWYKTNRKPWPVLEEVSLTDLQYEMRSWKDIWFEAGKQSHGNLESKVEKMLQLWIDDFGGFHERDAALFAKVYGKISIVPPDAYQMLYVRVSQGCPWNRCAFCSFYEDQQYHALTLNELDQHLVDVRNYWKSALSSRLGIFLGDANAIATPAEVLAGRMTRIQAVFPEFKVFDSFIDFFTGTKRTAADFAALKLRGLRRISLGIESGCAPLMDLVQKPVPAQEVIQLVTAARSAGLRINAIFLIGLGGKQWREKHFEESMTLIHRMELGEGDRIYLSPLVSRSHAMDPNYNREPMNALEIQQELRRWKQAVSIAVPQIQVSIYNIEHYIN